MEEAENRGRGKPARSSSAAASGKRGKAYNRNADMRSAEVSDAQKEKEAKKKKQAAAQKKHSHPAATPSVGQKVRQEKVVTSGSLGDESAEGCDEHNDIRYVLEEIQTGDSEADKQTAELQRLIVWGEILNSPKYKSRH